MFLTKNFVCGSILSQKILDLEHIEFCSWISRMSYDIFRLSVVGTCIQRWYQLNLQREKPNQ